MRAAWILTSLIIAGCAHQPLAAVPPAGVDLSGHWRLNSADSDDPQRLVQSIGGGAGADAADQDNGGGAGDSGEGDDRRPVAQRRGPANGERATMSFGAIGDALQWPGNDLVIKQLGGVVAFTSEGESHVYQPASSSPRRTRGADHRRSGGTCGWSGKRLIVNVTPDEGPALEERYQESADGRRLIQQITPAGGNSRGLMLIRVWDRVP
ncbi:MAG TPA: hypothetical protein VMV25_10575 [Steroidobacteraceae bacterium]|nr:hypothetical protein [Steroidobacteraceae bacterium]